MNKEIDIYERIQDYLRGRMSDEDRAAFERDLATDDTLRKQYEDLSLLAWAIKKANQEADLWMALKEAEEQIAGTSEDSVRNPALEAELDQVERELSMMGVPLPEPEESVIQKIKKRVANFFNALLQWFIPPVNVSAHPAEGNTVVFSLSYASRMAISFAVAASLALAIILPHNASMASSGFNYAPSRLELQIYRGGSSDMLEKAINSYNDEDYDAAISYLNEAKISVESAISNLGDSDEDVIARQDLTNDLYRIEYYRAYSLMKEKRVREAKRALRAISKSDSPFANEAIDILNNVY